MKLTSDNASVPQDTSGAFEVVGNFVVDQPDVTYTADCPEYSIDAVYTLEWEEPDCGLATYDEEGSDDDLKEKCGEVAYTVGLKSVNRADGVPHFVVLASSTNPAPACPSLVMFEGTSQGKKVKYTTKVHIDGSMDGSVHVFGSATLAELLKAEDKAEAIHGDQFHVFTNNCVTYAGSLWRNLEFAETEELGTFLVEEIMSKPGFTKLVESQMVQDDHGIDRKLLTSRDVMKSYLETFKSQLYL